MLTQKALSEYDLKLLKVFKAVVENGGFSAAEDELGITRSTISLHMSSLESRMKLTLCLRGRSGFVLTPDGQSVYQASLKLFSALGEFSHAVNSLSADLGGEIVILHSDILDDTRYQLLANTLSSLSASAPQLRITLDGARIDQIERALLSDKAHIGLFPGYRKVTGLHYRPTLHEPIYLCCSHNHPLFSTPDALITDELLASYSAVVPGVEISSDGRAQLKKLSAGACAYQFDSRRALIATGRYIGYLPKNYVVQAVSAGQFRFIKPDTYFYEFEQALVYKQVPAEPKKIERFLTLFEQNLGGLKQS